MTLMDFSLCIVRRRLIFICIQLQWNVCYIMWFYLGMKQRSKLSAYKAWHLIGVDRFLTFIFDEKFQKLRSLIHSFPWTDIFLIMRYSITGDKIVYFEQCFNIWKTIKKTLVVGYVNMNIRMSVSFKANFLKFKSSFYSLFSFLL